MTENTDPIDALIEKSKPLLANISFGAVMGFCSGYAMKKVGKALAFIVGMGFIGLQAAATTGYIQIDWEKLRLDVVKRVDTTGDGKFDANDCKAYWAKVKKLLTYELPSAGGFSLGFLYGVKSG